MIQCKCQICFLIYKVRGTTTLPRIAPILLWPVKITAEIGVRGNFTISFVQHDTDAGQVALDNISWTTYAGGGTPEPVQAPPDVVFEEVT